MSGWTYLAFVCLILLSTILPKAVTGSSDIKPPAPPPVEEALCRVPEPGAFLRVEDRCRLSGSSRPEPEVLQLPESGSAPSAENRG